MILQLVVPLVTVKAGLPRPAKEKASRSVVAAVSFVAGSSPGLGCFALVLFAPCRYPIGFATADLVIVAADPFSLAGPDLAAAAGFAVGLSVAVDSAATVFAAAGRDFAVAADLACSVVGPVCSVVAATGKERAAVGVSCSLTPRSFF